MKLVDILLGILICVVVLFFVYPYIKKYIPEKWLSIPESIKKGMGLHDCPQGYIWSDLQNKCIIEPRHK